MALASLVLAGLLYVVGWTVVNLATGDTVWTPPGPDATSCPVYDPSCDYNP